MAKEDENKQEDPIATDVTPVTQKRPLVLFTGTYYHTMDAKGRMVIPSDYREMLGDTFYVCPTPDFDAIAICTEETWNERNEYYLFASEHSAMMEEEITNFYSLSFKLHEFDSQGRILFPAVLRQVYLGEEHDMVVKGSQHYIRITVNTTEDVKLVNFRAKMVSDARKAEATRVKEKWVAQKENR